MHCETADVAEKVAVQGQNIDLQCNQSGTNIARERQGCNYKERSTGESRRVCIGKESSDVAYPRFCKSKQSERSNNAMFQEEERCCKYKGGTSVLMEGEQNRKEGKCHVTMRGTMSQGRNCICNRGDFASAMRRRCESDECNRILPPNTQYK